MSIEREPSIHGVAGPSDLEALLHATRRLLWLRRPGDARRVVTDLVSALGGSMVPADAPDEDTLPIDLSFGAGVPLFARAPEASVARLLLERYLPRFVEDASRAVALARVAEASITSAIVDRASTPTGAVVPTDRVEAYLEQASAGAHEPAYRIALEVLGDAPSLSVVVTDLLVPAQREVGLRWQRGELSVADEHVMTGVTETVLSRLANERPAAGTVHGRVVLCCADGDWHSLPGRMQAVLLRERGWSVDFLGASTPADEVARYFVRRRPDAVAISCSVPVFFPAVAHLVSVAHRAGLPVVCGGTAFATAPRRATALGADGWADDVTEAVRLLERWQERRPLLLADPPLRWDVLELMAATPEIATTAVTRFVTKWDDPRSAEPRFRGEMADHCRQLLLHLAAALLVDDPDVVRTFFGWLEEVLVARDVPTEVISLLVSALIGPVTDHVPDARSLLEARVDDLT